MTETPIWNLLITYMQRTRQKTALTIAYRPKPDGDAVWSYELESGNVLRGGDFSGAMVSAPDRLLRQLQLDLEYQHRHHDIRDARGDAGQNDDADDDDYGEATGDAQLSLLEPSP